MYVYINGFYQSPFAPNHHSRGAATSNGTYTDTSQRFANSIKTDQLQRLTSQSTFHGDFKKANRLPSIILTANMARAPDLLKLYRQLFAEHPHDTLPLETSLPPEFRFACRDQYRIIMTMILSGSMGDLQLTLALARLFNRRRSFSQFRGITKTELRNELKACGFGYNDPDRPGNGGRFWSLLQLYFGRWNLSIDEGKVLRIRAHGFGPKFPPLLKAYAFGDSEAFPLDSPAFKALKSFGFYTHDTLNQAREDVLDKLRDCSDLKLIDFHELLRFRWQFGGTRRRHRNVIMGWNGWRLLSLTQRTFISTEWIRANLIKDDDLAKEFMMWFSALHARTIEA